MTAAVPQGLTAAPRDRGLVGLWWLSPTGAVLMVVPATLGIAAAYTPADFQAYFRTPKSLTAETAVLFGLGALALVVGSLLAQFTRWPVRRAGRWPWFDDQQLQLLERCATVLFRVTMVGYVSFVLAGARNGVSIRDIVAAVISQDVSSGDLESQIGTVAGVTTLTQVGVAYGVVAALLLVHGQDRRRTLARVGVLLVVTLFRAFLLTERLAVIEVAVPVVAVLALRAREGGSAQRRLIVRLAPLPLVLLLVVGFAASEYSRSYQFFKTRTNDGLVVFSLKRLSGYYATAYNNGQILLDHDAYPGRLPYTSIEALWTAPGVKQVDLYNRLTGRDSDERYGRILQTYGSPEFNNPGGLPAPFVDFGRPGGIVVLFGVGLLTGLGYRAFVEGRPGGVLLYPIVVTGLLELPRFLYWTLGRTVPAVLALLLVLAALTRDRRYRPTLGP